MQTFLVGKLVKKPYSDSLWLKKRNYIKKANKEVKTNIREFSATLHHTLIQNFSLIYTYKKKGNWIVPGLLVS